MSITFIRCSDQEVGRRAASVGGEEEKTRRSVAEKLGTVLVYAIGISMVLLQLRSIL